jgi:ParB family chromosome partitioning protein
MSLTKDQAQRAASIDLDALGPLQQGVRAAAREPRTAPGQLMDLQSKYQDALATIERLSKGGVPMEVDINRLIRVPGRQRPLTPEERAELKANLAANPLIHPVTILPETPEGFELLSGYNRTDLYEELGRTKIPAVVIDVPKEVADVLAFYANLAPALPAYKKYEGLKALQAQHGYDQAALSKESGMSSSTISRLMQFDDLPAGAHEILRRNPHILGATAATGLAKASKAGRQDLVVEAVSKLAEAAADEDKKVRFTEENAVAHANGVRPAAPKPAAAAPLVVKQGKKNFAKLVVRGNRVTVELTDPSVSPDEWAAKFEAFMKAEIAKDVE